jgi:hypothetical protein
VRSRLHRFRGGINISERGDGDNSNRLPRVKYEIKYHFKGEVTRVIAKRNNVTVDIYRKKDNNERYKIRVYIYPRGDFEYG